MVIYVVLDSDRDPSMEKDACLWSELSMHPKSKSLLFNMNNKTQ